MREKGANSNIELLGPHAHFEIDLHKVHVDELELANLQEDGAYSAKCPGMDPESSDSKRGACCRGGLFEWCHHSTKINKGTRNLGLGFTLLKNR